MAAEIRTADRVKENHRKPQLVNKLEGHESTVNAAILITNEDGVISVSDDRTVRVWLKRDSGQYWPSICHGLRSEVASLDYSKETRRLFVGLHDGAMQEFSLSSDYNTLESKRFYEAHQSRVTAVKFSIMCEWVLSASRDKNFQWHCSETGQRLGSYSLAAWATCLVFDDKSKCAFIGDLSGTITVVRLTDRECSLVTKLTGHSGSIRALAWDEEQQQLFSGSFDCSIICWDIGGQQGKAVELQGHHEKVQALALASSAKLLFSAADDCSLMLWDTAVRRSETPAWEKSSSCMKCNVPFFWNVKQMWVEKTAGRRQHHCRRCGRALCDACCARKLAYPLMGFEYAVRMCDSCADAVADEEPAPAASLHDAKHRVQCMDLDERRCQLLTVGHDRVVKLWDVSSLLA